MIVKMYQKSVANALGVSNLLPQYCYKIIYITMRMHIINGTYQKIHVIDIDLHSNSIKMSYKCFRNLFPSHIGAISLYVALRNLIDTFNP